MDSRLQVKWHEHHQGSDLPKLPWVMKQTWQDLLFAHYPVKLEVLQQVVPSVFQLEQYNGTAWIGVVPFRVQNHRVRFLPPMPGINRFLQLNVRTYVTINGKRGVYFLSIDMNHLIARQLAKSLFYMPTQTATINMSHNECGIYFNSKTVEKGHPEFECQYTPIGQPFYARKETFEAWLVERYSMYSLNRRGEVVRCDILHDYWPLQYVDVEINNNSIFQNRGIQVASKDPILHYAKRMEAYLWPVARVTVN